MRSLVTSLIACALCCGAGLARADEPPAPVPPPSNVDEPPGAGAAPDVEAPPPDVRRDPAHYRGRSNPTTAAEVLSWIPRVGLYPLHLVAEYGLRVPIYAAAEWADRNHVVPVIEKILNPTPDIFWSPTLSLDLGSITFVGLQGRFRNLLVPGHELRVSAAFGGLDAWRLEARDRWQLGPHAFVGVRGKYESRWDRAFHGLGPRSGSYRTNFAQARGDAFAFAGVEYGNHFRLELAEGYRGEVTAGGGAPSIETRFSPRDLPGYGELRLAVATLDLKLDSRRIREESSGVRFLAGATYARDLRATDRSFVTAAAELEAGVEVAEPDRVLAGRVLAMDSFRTGTFDVPFSHLPALGGKDHHGFLRGRFRGESAVMAELQYRYPIAYYVDAQWTASAGNAFGERFDGFDVGALTGSLGVGLRTRRTGMAALELTFAVGTTRFEERFGVENFRVHFGTTEGL